MTIQTTTKHKPGEEQTKTGRKMFSYPGQYVINTIRENNNSEIVCPKCNGRLRERMTRSPFEPHRFLGCDHFPVCTYTIKF